MTFVPGDRPPFKDPLARQADLKWSDMSAQEKEQHKDKHSAKDRRAKKAKGIRIDDSLDAGAVLLACQDYCT